MAADKALRLVIVTPEKTVFDEPVAGLRFPLYDGEIGVLPGRLPLIGRLGAGELKVSLAGDEFLVRIGQKYQVLATSGERAGRPVNVIGSRLRGTEIGFTAFDSDGYSRRFEGRVDGSRMTGEAIRDGAAAVRWTATRQ